MEGSQEVGKMKEGKKKNKNVPFQQNVNEYTQTECQSEKITILQPSQ